jgi:potassium/chloride transporter 4/5/6
LGRIEEKEETMARFTLPFGTGASQSERDKLGAFLGVFTPSILTILGVIMYLRFGWVVGNAGLLGALAIVIIANTITLITALSVSAVASNMRVGVGGAYYLISRSLGLEIGAAIGLPLYLSQTFSVTLYSFGLAESLRIVWPGAPLQPVTLAVIFAVTLLSTRGAAIALKSQLPVMAAIGLSLAVFFIGGARGGHAPQLFPSLADSPGFWTVFAVFFPAVTGIMAGVSLSGDLKDPSRSIAVGIISAVLVGFLVYLLVPIVLSFTADPESLVRDSLIWRKVAIWPVLIFPGLWGAILSSAVGSILGAPRTLQALAIDRVAPRFFGRASERGPVPLAAVWFSGGVALAAVALGNLNTVASVLTMFFLTTYGMINLVAGLEKLAGDPSYRPTFNIPWWVSFAGAFGCLAAMYLMSPLACVLAIFIELALWLGLRRRAVKSTWGDLRRGLWMAAIRYSLLHLKATPEDPRNWRPNILVFAGEVQKRLDLVQFASWFSQNRGIVTVCDLIEGDLAEDDVPLDERRKQMNTFLDERGLGAFGEVHIVRNFEEGVVNVSQANGIAGIASNTLMFGWSRDPRRNTTYFTIMRQMSKLHKSMVLLRVNPQEQLRRTRRIDIWWGGLQRNGDLMLLLAHLLSLNPDWNNANITIKSIASNELMFQETERHLALMIPEVRIKAEQRVRLKSDDRPIIETIHEESHDADVVFMGLAQPEPGEEAEYVERLSKMMEGLPTVVLVKNSTMFAGDLV